MADATLLTTRKAADKAVQTFCLVATIIGLFFLASILYTLLWNGLGGLNLTVFTEQTKGPGSGGGLANAIVGTIIQTALGLAIGAPIGLLAGTYLAEVAGGSQLGKAVRFVSDVLLSAPSILIGLFVYQLVVLNTGGFSALAGSMALAIIIIPVVLRTTEDMLRLLPVSLREAAYALGAPRWRVVSMVCWRSAKDGIMTGVLLGIARIAGETAPLLFTSFGNSNWNIFGLNAPMASLPVVINQYAASPANDWVELAWVGALLISAGVLLLNVAARVISARGNSKR